MAQSAGPVGCDAPDPGPAMTFHRQLLGEFSNHGCEHVDIAEQSVPTGSMGRIGIHESSSSCRLH